MIKINDIPATLRYRNIYHSNRGNISFCFYSGESGYVEQFSFVAKNIFGNDLVLDFLTWLNDNKGSCPKNKPLYCKNEKDVQKYTSYHLNSFISFIMQNYYSSDVIGCSCHPNEIDKQICITLFDQIMKKVHCNSKFCEEKDDYFHGPLERDAIINMIGQIYLLTI